MAKAIEVMAGLTLGWWRAQIDERVTEVEVRARDRGVHVHVLWNEGSLLVPGSYDCHAALSGEGPTLEDAIADLHHSCEPRTGTLTERFQVSADWYAQQTTIRIDFTPEEADELAAKMKDRWARRCEREKTDSDEEDIFAILKRHGYAFRYTMCTTIDKWVRDEAGRVCGVTVPEPVHAAEQEARWKKNDEERRRAALQLDDKVIP